jgi:hypothetical protein
LCIDEYAAGRRGALLEAAESIALGAGNKFLRN